MKFSLPPESLPSHIAFIMDGNGRWAKKRLLPRKVGHREGVKTLEKIVDEVFSLKIPYVSIFAFSTENWNRPQDEIDALFELIREYFDKMLSKFIEKGIKITFMGDLSKFPTDLKQVIDNAISLSAGLTVGNLNIGLNYGARDEITRAVNIAVKNGMEVTEKEFAQLLYTKDIPDPDIIVRTSGEMRLSNFMLFQAAYSEFFFTETLWPDFNKNELYSILEKYSKRERRFGKV